MAAGALFVSSRIGATSLASMAMVMIMVQGAGLSVQTILLSLPLAIGCYLVGGIGHGTKNVLVRTLIHERTPANAHGRSGAAYNALRNGAELGALALGGLPGRGDRRQGNPGHPGRCPDPGRDRGARDPDFQAPGWAHRRAGANW